ncbi:hypothetical protein ACEQPO_09695 [Bacillus sp. SL00103]
MARKRSKRWFLLYREDGQHIHLYEPLKKYELHSRIRKGLEDYQMKNKFLEGDWIKASGKARETLNKEGYVLKVSEDDILVRFLSGNTLVVPKSWAENLDEVLTEDEI